MLRSLAVFSLAVAGFASSVQQDTTVSQLCENMGYVPRSGRQLLGVKNPHFQIRPSYPRMMQKQDPADVTSKEIATLAGSTMKVGVCMRAPYSMKSTADQTPDPYSSNNSPWTGFSVQSFELMAKNMSIAIQMVEGTYEQHVSNMEAGNIDTIISGMFLTKRIRQVYPKWGFTHSFWQSGIAILVPIQKGNNAFVAIITNTEIWVSVFLIVASIIVFGHCYWLLERETDKQSVFNENGEYEAGVVPNSYFEGVSMGMWWSAATMTTVGYGDIFPKTWRGRGCSCIVMFVCMVLVAIFMGTITTAMTVSAVADTDSGISSVKDLAGMDVAVLKGTMPDHFMTSHSKAKLLRVDVMADAMDAMLTGKVAAIVGVADVLRYQTSQHPGASKMVGFPFHQHGLVWPFNDKSSNIKALGGAKAVADAISAGLLALEDAEALDVVVQEYFADK